MPLHSCTTMAVNNAYTILRSTILPLDPYDITESHSSICSSISGPFGDSMSAAARPKRWVCHVKQKVKSSISPRGELLPYLLDGACYEGYLGQPGEAKKKKEVISVIWNASDGSDLVPTSDVK